MEISPEEIQEYLSNEQYLAESPGLFSKSTQWFRFDRLETILIDGHHCILPVKNSKMIVYEPFKFFPQILADYLTLIARIMKIENEFAETDYGEISDEAEDKLYLRHDERRAHLLLPFIQKYGPFGLVNYYIERFETDHENSIPNHTKRIVILRPNIKYHTGLHFKVKLDNGNFWIRYDDLAAYFLPRLNPPYPFIDGSPRDVRRFYSKYGEKAVDINRCYTHSKIYNHQRKYKEFVTTQNKPDDNIKSYQEEGKPTVLVSYRRALEIGFGDLSMVFHYDKNKKLWDLNWNFNSLLQALEIMYMLSFVGK